MAGKVSNVYGRGLRAKIKRDKAAQADPIAAAGWLPIETAPKDGTEILIAGTYVLLPDEWVQFVDISRWFQERWDGFSPTYYTVTHWMPKPDPPPRESSESHPRK